MPDYVLWQMRIWLSYASFSRDTGDETGNLGYNWRGTICTFTREHSAIKVVLLEEADD